MTRTLFKNLTAILMSAVVAAVLAACNNPGSDAQAVTGAENVPAITAGVRPTCSGEVPTVDGKNNCHGFAWQNDTGIPMGLSGYGIDGTYIRDYFLNGKNFSKLGTSTTDKTIPEDADDENGDKVIYSSGSLEVAHSAVVYSKKTDRFISYCMSYDKPRIRRPDDPSGRFTADGSNYFGDDITYYHCIHTCFHGGSGGIPIRVLYDGKLGVDMDKEKKDYTAFVVNDSRPKDVIWRYTWTYVVGKTGVGSIGRVGGIGKTNHEKKIYTSSFSVTPHWSEYPNADYMVIMVIAEKLHSREAYYVREKINKVGEPIN